MALKILKEKRFREMILLSFVALGLLIACYFVFGNKDGFVEPNKQVAMSQTESKLCSILSAIDGVGEIIAYVNEDAEGEILGAVLVFEGADSNTQIKK